MLNKFILGEPKIPPKFRNRPRFRQAKQALLAALADPEKSVVRTAGWALWHSSPPPGALRPLLALLEKGRPESRLWAARLLGNLEDRKALRALARRRLDPEAQVRQAARQARDDLDGNWAAAAFASGRVRGHDDRILALAVSPTGRTLASGDAGGDVILWDRETGRAKRLLRRRGTRATGVQELAFGQADRVLAIGDGEGFTVFDLAAGKPLCASPPLRNHQILAGKYLPGPLVFGRGIVLLDENGAPRRRLRPRQEIYSLVCSADSSVVAVFGKGNEVLDGRTGRRLWRLPEKVSRCAISPTGYFLAAVLPGKICGIFGQGALALWRGKTGELRSLIPLPWHAPEHVEEAPVFSPDGRLLAYQRGVWETGSGDCRWLDQAPTPGGFRLAAFTPDSQTICLVGEDHVIALRDARTGAPKKLLGRPRNEIQTLAVPQEGPFLAAGYQEGVVRLWPLAGGRSSALPPPLAKPLGGSLAWAPRLPLLAGTGAEGRVWLWDVSRQLAAGEIRPWAGEVRSVAWSPDGETLALGGYRLEPGKERSPAGALWNPRRKTIAPLETKAPRDEGILSELAFSPNGQFLAGIIEGRLAVWGDGFHHPPLVLPEKEWLGSAAFSPDGKLLAVGTMWFEVQLWDTTHWGLLRTIDLRGDSPISLSFSAEGRTLAIAAAYKNEIELRDVESGALVGLLRGHRAPCRAVAFLPGGKRLASGSVDGSVRLWTAADSRLLRTIYP